MFMPKPLFIFIFTCIFWFSNAQKEATQWYFAQWAGLNFLTSPPSVLTGSMLANWGCASIADENGVLQFYTNGEKVWNKAHQIMANGSGLLGNNAITQPALCIKKPGSNILYYIITQNSVPGPNAYKYSIVDMSLAAGMGSVTVKNAELWTPSQSSGKLAGVKHCNGLDYWIMTGEAFTPNYHAFLLSATGINTTAVVSVQGNTVGGIGQMKFSANGKKMGLVTSSSSNASSISVFDFDNSTGMVSSNSVALNSISVTATGLEFSPDGTKLYATSQSQGQPFSSTVWQWDLCAGSASAIAASVNTLSPPQGTLNGCCTNFGCMQLGPDGKIYLARMSQQSLGVVNNPNVSGTGCNFVQQGQFHPYGSLQSLPAFVSSYFRNLQVEITSTISCSNVQFSAPTHVQPGCSGTDYTLISSFWNFGDPASGAGSNLNANLNPSHLYSGAGTYTVMLLLKFQCTTDTIYHVLNIINPTPSFSIAGIKTICKNEFHTLVADNPAYSYVWLYGPSTTVPATGTLTGTSAVVTQSAVTFYTVSATDTTSGCSSKKIFNLNVNSCLGLEGNLSPENMLKIFPNPGFGLYDVESDLESCHFSLYNRDGILVKAGEILIGLSKIDIRDLADGVYYINVTSAAYFSTGKLVKFSK